jgi:aminoglycoside/choline kinase family phosphotransferase
MEGFDANQSITASTPPETFSRLMRGFCLKKLYPGTVIWRSPAQLPPYAWDFLQAHARILPQEALPRYSTQKLSKGRQHSYNTIWDFLQAHARILPQGAPAQVYKRNQKGAI